MKEATEKHREVLERELSVIFKRPVQVELEADYGTMLFRYTVNITMQRGPILRLDRSMFCQRDDRQLLLERFSEQIKRECLRELDKRATLEVMKGGICQY